MTKDRTLDSSKLPHLIVTLPDGKEEHHAIIGSEVTIGRDPSNRISIADHAVSKFHAKLLLSGESIKIVDLGSSNKTYVNGRPISEATVQYGDEIRFASAKCRLEAQLADKRPDAHRQPAPPVSPQPRQARPPTPAPSVPSASLRAPTPGRARTSPTPPSAPTNPTTRLLFIGGGVIGVSLLLAILLRVLLVPSEDTAGEKSGGGATPAVTTSPAQTTEGSGSQIENSAGATSSVTPSRRGGSAADQSVEYYFEEALSALDIGRLKEAHTNFLKVLEIDPQNTRAKTRLSLLEEEIESQAERHFTNARQAFNFLRYNEAIAEWEMFLALADPSDSRYGEAQKGIEQARAKLR